MFYHDRPINIRFKGKTNDELALGRVLLSRTGRELVPICGSKPIPEFVDYVLGVWLGNGYVTFSDSPRKTPRPTVNGHG